MRILANYFANPISVLIATIFTFINFLVILLPFYLTLILFIDSQSNLDLSNNIFIYTMIFMFIFTLAYLCLDFYYGFTIKSFVKDCVQIDKIPELGFLQKNFDETIKNFKLKNVEFLLKDSEEINAFAVLSLRKKYVVITTGMIDHILKSLNTHEAQDKAFKGLIAHELSHLINWDSLPNLILLSGQVVAVILSNILTFVSTLVIRIISVIPIVSLFAVVLTYIFLLLQFLLNMVYSFILHPLYLLVERFLGRLIEHRSDYQSAKALSWESMYICLNSLMALNGNTFNSSFSTHPSTINRILHIYKIEKSPENIKVSFFSKYFSLILLFASLVLSVYFLLVNFNNLNYLNEILKDYLALFYSNTKDLIFYIHETKLYLPILASITAAFLSFYIFKNILLFIKKVYVSKNLNRSENTPIDFLLLYAIQNNDLNTFLNILKSGANIDVVFEGHTIETYAQHMNPKFLKHIEKIKA